MGGTRQQRRQQPGVSVKRGCGCLVPVILLAVVAPIAVGLFSVIREAVESTGGEVQDEGIVVVGDVAEGGIGSGDTDRWTLAGQEGRFVVSVTPEGDFDPTVEVHEVGGESLGEDDDSLGGRGSQLTVTLSSGTTYEIDVEGFNDDTSGDYELLVSQIEVDAGTLVTGETVRGAVGPEGVVRYRYVGPGREVSISVNAVSRGFDPRVTVFGPDRQELGSDDDGGVEGLDSLLVLEIPAGQEVVVEVTEFSGDPGAFNIGVE
jgi:hypothetical protein